MADVVLTLTVPSDKVAVAVTGFLKLYPNVETIDDPEWVQPDPDDGSSPDQISKYTIKQWVEEKWRRNLVRDIRRGLQMLANDAAVVADDDGMVV